MKEYDADSSRIGSGGGQKSKMVGFSEVYIELRDGVIYHGSGVVQYVAIYGMAGIGKTTLAKELIDDRLTLDHFDCSAWVEVGRNRQLEEIVQSILAQVNPYSDKMLMKGDDDISKYLEDSLRGRKYLIVLDDVWDEWVKREIHCLLPNISPSSVVLLTTRLEAIANQICGFSLLPQTIKMRLLDEEESWNLLREKVFGEEPCPSQLEKAGKKIAEHCDGLPLTLVTVADLLSKAEKTPQYWNELVAKKNHQLFMAAYNEISEVLLPSYERLPKILQLCFLYMGVFPQNYKIPRSKLFNMWNTDGFLKGHAFSNKAMECLDKLVSNSLVLIYQSTIGIYKKEQVKTCGLHSSFCNLSNNVAWKNKFNCVLNCPNDCLREHIKGQQRLSFHNNILLGYKDVYKSVQNNCKSTARSLLFYGPYHQYQIPVCFGLKRIRQLDALAIRFYEFPVKILQLVQLRYLALTINGELPTSISQLSNLEVLIIGRHMSIKSYRAPSYLPMGIWNLKELYHLQVMGCDLLDPPSGTSLKKLSTLSNVSPLSCTEGILKAIPYLEKLGIQIELVPDDDGKPLSCFDDIFHLKWLKSLKCVVENPEVARPLAPFSNFSSRLEKLSLSGLGYSWKQMSKLSSLPRLFVLKLRSYAFRGPKWELEEGEFSVLYSLVIEDTDLEEWNIGSGSFPYLCHLSLKHCYRLEKIHGRVGEYLEKIEFIDCNPIGVKQMEKFRCRWTELVLVNSSWNDGKKAQT